MARSYLTAPGESPAIVCFSRMLIYLIATSVDVERVFSRGRLVLSHIRNRLSAESTRALLCVGEWSRKGLIDDMDLIAVTSATYNKDEDDAVDNGWNAIIDSL